MISCKKIWFHPYCKHIHKKGGRGIQIRRNIYTSLDSQQLGVIKIVKKTGFNVRATFDQSYFAPPVLHNILHHFFAWKFYHFTYLPILEGYIIKITNYYYDKYFSIDAWENLGVSCDAKVKLKYHKKKGKKC